MKLSIKKIVISLLLIFGGQLFAQQERSDQETRTMVIKDYLEVEYGVANDWMKAKMVEPKTYQFIVNNNEGKFESFQVIANEILLDFANHDISTNKEMKASLVFETYADFITQVINDILKKEKEYNSIRFYTQSRDTKRNASEEDWYRSYRNKLIYYLKIKDKLEIQLGKSVKHDVNKTYISELDKTVFNSLNLLALNY